jgi:hypothetical protein
MSGTVVRKRHNFKETDSRRRSCVRNQAILAMINTEMLAPSEEHSATF